MKLFIAGLLTPPAVWVLSYFAAKGWYGGRPTQTINVKWHTKSNSEE